MKPALKCFSTVVTAILAVSFAVAWAPVSRAAEDKPSDSAAAQPASASAAAQPASSSATSAASSETLQRLAELEKEIGALQDQIAALKESEAASMKAAAAAALVQPVSAPKPDDAPAKVTLAGLLGPVTLSGFVDTYYAFNFNQPTVLGTGGTSGFGGNTGQFFDNNTNQFSLNAIELVADKAADATTGGTGRAGYHVGIIYGQAAAAINGSPATGTFNNLTDANNIALKEAYIDYIAPVGKGLTITVGKFVTPAGNEVIETNGNWNYSRSILFYYAIPYFHFGINAKYTFNPKWSITGYLVNGWNNSQEPNTGKTYGVSLAWTPNKYWSVTENYLAGPQDDIALGTGYVGHPNDNWRQLEDAVLAYTPNAKWAFAFNGDYGYGDKTGNGATIAGNSPAVDWWGVAPYAKYTFNAKAYFAARYEYFSDPQGFAFAVPFVNTHVGEGTATFAYNLTDQFQTRFEFREDYANRPLFLKGSSKFEETQPILEVGFIYTFSSVNAKW